MKYKLAIFDLDGTILDTLEDLKDATNYALNAYHMPSRTLLEVRKFVGNGIHRLIEQAVIENTSEEEIDAIFHTFNVYYKEHCKDQTKPYDGIKELVLKLKENGILCAVVSNKADYAVQILCEDYFSNLFDYCVGEKEGIRRKPYPDTVFDVLDKFNMKQEDAVYIGDSEVDYKTSLNANMDVILVTWGFRDESYLRTLGATNFAYTPMEIFDKIIK